MNDGRGCSFPLRRGWRWEAPPLGSGLLQHERTPMRAMSLGNQGLCPGLSFPICEMKPWTRFSPEALLAQRFCSRMSGERVREDRPVPDLLAAPQEAPRGPGSPSRPGTSPSRRGWQPGQGGQEQRLQDCADKAVPSPLLFSLPPPLPGDSRAQQKINPKTVTWTG